jgi:hypothetical protein
VRDASLGGTGFWTAEVIVGVTEAQPFPSVDQVGIGERMQFGESEGQQHVVVSGDRIDSGVERRVDVTALNATTAQPVTENNSECESESECERREQVTGAQEIGQGIEGAPLPLSCMSSQPVHGFVSYSMGEVMVVMPDDNPERDRSQEECSRDFAMSGERVESCGGVSVVDTYGDVTNCATHTDVKVVTNANELSRADVVPLCERIPFSSFVRAMTT